MKKRLLAIVVAAASLFATTTVFADNTFSDISGESYAWCAPQIEAMSEEGYINGYEDGTFRPDNEVTKLEGISLFARMMGSNDNGNEKVIAMAHEQYDNAVKGSSLPWGEDEIVYMMYRGALTAADLTTYINGDAKNQPLTRGEAAVIITKAMGAESKATAETAVSLHYKDASEIPTNILQYVKFVTDEGIMNGIDDAFCADQSVTRAQITVMLHRVWEKCDYDFDMGRVIAIDTDTAEITYSVDGEQATFTYTDDTNFYIRGEKTTVTNIPENVEAVIQFSGDKVVGIDAMSDQGDMEISAIYLGYNSSSTVLTIKVKDSETSTIVKTYRADVDVPITYQGSPATMKALQTGDAIVLSMSDGKVVAINAVEKITNISGVTIAEITVEGDKTYITVASNDKKLDGKKYPVADSVSVTKNSKEADLTQLYIGDSASMTLKYGEVTKITATAISNTIEGVITAIHIADKSELTLRVGNETRVYAVPTDCEMEIKGESGDIYGLRLGDNITLTVQSNAIIKIKSVASITNTTGRISGTVTAVNPTYKFVSVLMDDNTTLNVQVNTKTAYNLVGGTSSKTGIEQITVGDTVDCYVTPSNGAYVADLIVISK